METVLVIDADSVLARALCRELVDAGCRVLAHFRSEQHGPPAEGAVAVTASRPEEALERWNESLSPIGHVIFGQPSEADSFGEQDGFEALAALTEARLTGFLAELQAAAKLLTRGHGGQIWVLTQEDSIHYYTKRPCLPIDTRARHAAVKSFAKEVFRFGVRINCASVQLLAEQATQEEWRLARDGLKAFAMKFKPISAASAARTLRHFLGQADLPISGMVVPIGIGFAESNV